MGLARPSLYLGRHRDTLRYPGIRHELLPVVIQEEELKFLDLLVVASQRTHLYPRYQVEY